MISELFNTHFRLESIYTLTAELFFKDGNLKHKWHFHKVFDLGKCFQLLIDGALCTFTEWTVDGAACHFSAIIPCDAAALLAPSIKYKQYALKIAEKKTVANRFYFRFPDPLKISFCISK